jgi:DNA repair exonuclease SbcCD ATPase subunit
MELLEQLEERVTALLAKLENLAKENASLREQAEVFSALEKENAELKTKMADLVALERANRTLRDERDRERQKNRAALTRLDVLVRRMKDLPE